MGHLQAGRFPVEAALTNPNGIDRVSRRPDWLRRELASFCIRLFFIGLARN
jgi:hypothetical protein